MKRNPGPVVLAAALTCLVSGPLFAVDDMTIESKAAAIGEAVAESKAQSLNPTLDPLLEQVRTGSDRKVRMAAIEAVVSRFSSESAMDQGRIADALLWAGAGNDIGIRHYAMNAVGKVAGSADEWTSRRIAEEVADRIDRTKVKMPYDDPGYREDLLRVYAKAGARVRSVIGNHADYFLDGVFQDIRDDIYQTGSRSKAAAALSLYNYLYHGGLSNLYSNKPAALARISRELLDISRQYPDAFRSRGSYAPNTDPDLTFRFSIARTLLLFYSIRPGATISITDPNLRVQLKDLLTRMYYDETDPTLKYYLGIHLGLRRLEVR